MATGGPRHRAEGTAVRSRIGLSGLFLVVLVALSGGWMLFDGLHAFATGDYVTPSEGDHAGQLGPWAALVSAVGLEPRSTAMETVFVLYGASYLTALIGYLVRRSSGASLTLQAVAVLGLWYLPFGTLLNLIAVGLLRLGPLREPRPVA